MKNNMMFFRHDNIFYSLSINPFFLKDRGQENNEWVVCEHEHGHSFSIKSYFNFQSSRNNVRAIKIFPHSADRVMKGLLPKHTWNYHIEE